MGFPLERSGVKFDVLNRDGESWKDGLHPTNLEAFTQIYEANVRLLFSPAAMVGDHVGESDSRNAFNQRRWAFPSAEDVLVDLVVHTCEESRAYFKWFQDTMSLCNFVFHVPIPLRRRICWEDGFSEIRPRFGNHVSIEDSDDEDATMVDLYHDGGLAGVRVASQLLLCCFCSAINSIEFSSMSCILYAFFISIYSYVQY